MSATLCPQLMVFSSVLVIILLIIYVTICHKIKINSLNKKEWFSLMKTLQFHDI